MSTRVAAPAELLLDVSASLPFHETVGLAASVHLPDLATGAPRAVLVCWPGGSYARAYWDMHIGGHPGYSFVDHMAAQGYVVVAADHLGVGASSKPSDGDRVDFETSSAAAASFVEQLRVLLADGAPALGGAPLSDIPVIGVGHSLGACLTTVTQARHRCYDGVALLGFTHGEKELSVSAAGAWKATPMPTPRLGARRRSSRRARSSETPGMTSMASCHASPITAGCIALTCPPRSSPPTTPRP
jgi:pimeloyl-ACP methyl ester carboxylesterase